jgi:hypothetical protein
MNTAVPSKTVELTLKGRLYGQPAQTTLERALQEPPPEIGSIFVEDIKKASAILALPDEPTRSEIFAAYGKDILDLTRRRQEADRFMLAVLECGMDRFHVEFGKRKAEKDSLQRLLEPLGVDPQIGLTADKSALPEAELTAWLKAAFHSEIGQIARRIATTLHHLADHQVVGLVDWKGLDVCMLHYFTWSAEHSSNTKHERTGDIMSWNTLTTTVAETIRLKRTRHTHHVVNAGVHQASDYKLRMPSRIKLLLANAPAWLKPHLVVIDGYETLSMETTTLADESVSEQVHSVMRYDPAVAIGNFTLAGWNEQDVQKESADATDWKKTLLVVPAIFGAVIALVSIFIHFNDKWSMERYEAYTQGLVGEQFTTVDGAAIKLPIDYKLVYHAAVERRSIMCFSTWAASNGEIPAREVWTNVLLPDSIEQWGYGDLDLRREFGLPFILHVSYAGPDKMNYTVERTEELELEGK